MCDVCLQSPCASRCPNAPEPDFVYICSGCGAKIYPGDSVWHIMGEQFCELCIDKAKKEAEWE